MSSIAFLGGPKAEVNFAPVMMKRLMITGSTLRPRTVAEKAEIAEELKEHVLPFLASRRVSVVIDSTFPLAKAADAHARLESGHIGKIVLTSGRLSLPVPRQKHYIPARELLRRPDPASGWLGRASCDPRGGP